MPSSILKYPRKASFSLAGFCAGLVVIAPLYVARGAADSIQTLATEDLPTVVLKDRNREIGKFKYLGSWIIPAKASWESVVTPSFDKSDRHIRLASSESRIMESPPRTIMQTDGGMAGMDVPWADNQVSMIAFRAISEYPRPAILQIDADGQISAYNNGRLLEGMPGARSRDYGFRFHVPVTLEKGPNIFCIKITSSNGPPRLRVSAIVDRSMELQMAWDEVESLLAEKIIPAGGNPTLRWNPLLDRLRVSVEVTDALGGGIVLKRDNMRNGGILRDGPRGLAQGLYKVTYNAGKETAAEYFIMGSPRAAFDGLKRELEKTNIPPGKVPLNVEALLRRGETLLVRENYNTDDQNWREKVIHALGGLADIAGMMGKGREDFARDIPGMHIRGFYSRIDGSKQFYRLFVPSTYDSAQGMPLLVIMPTPVLAKGRPFIESPFMAAHQTALLISKFAKRHGFAVLWPGYRNAPAGWTCEVTHADEVINIVEADYNIDKSRISVYGNCGGGYFAGCLASAYPGRFAAIAYDRAIFDRDIADLRKMPVHESLWHEALSPADRVIDNKQIKILVINDGSAEPGHGDIEWSEKFVERALAKRNDIKVSIEPPSEGSHQWNLVPRRWDMIFAWLGSCRNEAFNQEPSTFLREEGYAGPVADIFATPFIVVRGTSDAASGAHTDPVIEHIQKSYREHFHGAEPIIKNDREVTEQEVKDHSLILVGNPESNAIWKKLEKHIPIEVTTVALSIKGHQFYTNSAFLAIFEHPLNAGRHILTIGSFDLDTLGLVQNEDPCKASYDCRVFEPDSASKRTHTVIKLNTNNE